MKTKRKSQSTRKNGEVSNINENREATIANSISNSAVSNDTNRPFVSNNRSSSLLSSVSSSQSNALSSSTSSSHSNSILSSLATANGQILPTSNSYSFSPPANNNNPALFSININPALLPANVNSITPSSLLVKSPAGRKYLSNVWLYATKSSDGKSAKCSLCPYTCAIVSHSTSTIRYHLIHKHNKYDLVTDSTSSSQTKVTISEQFKRYLHSLCYEAIVIDQRPFNDLRRKGIMEIFNAMCPGYTPPHRNQVSSQLKHMFKQQYQILKNELKDTDYIGLTMDFWSSRSCVSYLCVTGHYFKDEMKFTSKIIHFASFNERHTAENIAKNLEENLSALGIYDKIIAITCDGGGNLVAAVKKLRTGIKRIWCCTHRLHLVVVNGLCFWNNKLIADTNQKNHSSKSHSTETDASTSISTTNTTTSNDYEMRSEENSSSDYNLDDTSFEDDDGCADGNYSIMSQNDANTNDFRFENENDVEHSAMIVTDRVDDHNTMPVNDPQGDNGYTDNYDELNHDEFIDDVDNLDLVEDNWSKDVETSVATTKEVEMVMVLLHKCRGIATLTRKSVIVANFLRSCVSSFKVNKKILNDCKSRWNSTYALIDSMIIVKPLLMHLFVSKETIKLCKEQLNKLKSIELSDEDWNFLLSLHELLKPFLLGTEIMSGKNYPSIGLAYYVIQSIRYFCYNNDNDDERVIELKKRLLEKMNKYFFHDIEQVEYLQFHAYFDPIAHKSFTDTDIQKCEKYIRQLILDDVYPIKTSLSDIPNVTSSTASNVTTAALPQSSSTSKPLRQSTYDSFMRACGDQPSTTETVKEKSKRISLNEELKQYKAIIPQFNLHTVPSTSSALHFWQMHHAKFPLLSHLAKVHLVACGSSVPSESAFSSSAFVARKERSHLSPENLAYSVFLKDKFDKS